MPFHLPAGRALISPCGGVSVGWLERAATAAANAAFGAVYEAFFLVSLLSEAACRFTIAFSVSTNASESLDNGSMLTL